MLCLFQIGVVFGYSVTTMLSNNGKDVDNSWAIEEASIYYSIEVVSFIVGLTQGLPNI